MGAAASGYLLGGPRFGLLLGIVSAEGCRIPIIVEGSPQLVRATTADCEKLEEDEEIGIIKEVRSTRYHWSDEILYTETHYWIAP
jgi:hypothetical protein